VSEGRNFFQEWKQKRAQESATAPDPASASFEPTPGPAAGDLPAPKDAPERFQWTEERDQAIQQLLETTVPGTLPSVHGQLQAIRHKLLSAELPSDRAQQLLGEVQAYLRTHLAAESGKRPVSHAGLTRARSDKLNALHAWQQCAEAMLQYLEKKEDVYLEVAAYAGDQGSAFLASSRRLLLESEADAEPEFDEDLEPDEEFEEE
jgi:hypothetical protein